MEQLEFMNRIATDKGFRDKLRKDPKATLAHNGENTGDVELKIVQDTASVRHIAMPYNPNELLDDSTLENVAGGGWRPFKALKKKGSSSFGCAGSCASSSDVAGVG